VYELHWARPPVISYGSACAPAIVGLVAEIVIALV
jgi:hypothetical protein